MENQDKQSVIIRTKDQRGEGKEESQKTPAPQQSKPSQQKNQQSPVSLLQQRLDSQKQEHQKLKSQVGSLAAQWKKQQQTLQEQQEKLEALENGQKSLVEALNQIAKAMDEFLQNERPEGSQAAQDVAQRVLAMEEQIGLIWEAVEKLEKHTGLAS